MCSCFCSFLCFLHKLSPWKGLVIACQPQIRSSRSPSLQHDTKRGLNRMRERSMLPRICASITTSRSPLCLARRPSLDRSGELYTFDPKSNINQFPGCRKVRANCKCAFIVHSNRRTRCRCSVQYKRHSIHVRLLTFDSCFGLWVSTIVQTSTARTSNAPKTTT